MKRGAGDAGEIAFDVVQDRVRFAGKNRARIVEDLETALRYGKGLVSVYPADGADAFSVTESETEAAGPVSKNAEGGDDRESKRAAIGRPLGRPAQDRTSAGRRCSISGRGLGC